MKTKSIILWGPSSNPNPNINIWDKGAFTNYVYKIWLFLTTYPPPFTFSIVTVSLIDTAMVDDGMKFAALPLGHFGLTPFKTYSILLCLFEAGS